MTVYALPVRPSIPWQRFSVELDRRTYVFDFRWNTREGAWFFSVADALEAPIATGKKVVLDWGLTKRIADRRIYPGVIAASDTSNTGAPPTVDDLGTRVLVLYHDAASLLGYLAE